MAEFQEAFRHLNNDVQATNTSYLYLSYGDFLSSRHEYKHAVRIYKEGLSIAGKKGNKVFTHNLYKSVSSAYEKLNDYDSSLLFYKMYHSVSDSLFNIKDERAIRELTLMYENTKHEAELHARTKSVHLMAILTVSILIIAIILWRMYRYKEHMYTILAKKYSEIVKRDNYRGKEEQSNRLFREIETLMRERHIYRESNLTREKAASMLGTNRTYLSQCINRNTGKSFSQYVNGYRIKNALTLLSDPDDTTPVKAVAIDSGFCSFSTFNTAFKEEIGMPPSVYREKIRQLAKNRLKEDSETAI